MAIAIDLLCWVLQLGPIFVLSFSSNPLRLPPVPPSRQAHAEEQEGPSKDLVFAERGFDNPPLNIFGPEMLPQVLAWEISWDRLGVKGFFAPRSNVRL